MSSEKRTCTRRGFTLVELLVVIGIIAILISVLLPTLASARRAANKVKCQSQLREIGNALKLYQGEYKGYWPVVEHEATPTFPNNPNLRSDPPRDDYWYQFLLKYFTNRQFVGTGGKRLTDFMNTPLWGCPAVEKIDADAAGGTSAEFNSGYGMGPYAAYSQTKFVGVNSGPHWAMIKNKGTPCEGQYYKMTQWVNPAEKCIIADSRAWFMETRSVANAGAIVDPQPQGAIGYDGNATHQFDKWRHSKKRGGKNPMSMNMLYCDGHVTEVTDIVEAFKAIRGHFPL